MAKVAALVDHLRRGGEVPPIVAVLFSDGSALPMDGHHRLQASVELGLDCDAWTITSRQFDRLCMHVRNAEDYVLCGGMPAMSVAGAWAEYERGHLLCSGES